MRLKDLQVPKVEVQAPGGTFAVRALNLTDLKFLINSQGDQLRQLFSDFMNHGSDAVKGGDFIPLLKQVAAKAPELIVEVVALAADADEEDRQVLARLPLGVHLEALGKIATATLTVDGDPKKSMETVTKLLGGVNFLTDAVVAGMTGQVPKD